MKPLCLTAQHTVPKVINFSRYNMKCSGENEKIMRNISYSIPFSSTFHVIWGKFGLLCVLRLLRFYWYQFLVKAVDYCLYVPSVNSIVDAFHCTSIPVPFASHISMHTRQTPRLLTGHGGGGRAVG